MELLTIGRAQQKRKRNICNLQYSGWISTPLGYHRRSAQKMATLPLVALLGIHEVPLALQGTPPDKDALK